MISQEDVEQMDRELDAHMAQGETSPPDTTSAEDVERLARDLLEEPGLFYHNVAAVLRALLAERDAARAALDEAAGDRDAYGEAIDGIRERIGSPHNQRAFIDDAVADAIEAARARGVVDGMAQAAVIAADMAKDARERAARRFLRTSKARDEGAADALAAFCDRIGEEIKRRG